MCVCVGVEAQERHTESLPSSTQSHQPMPEMQTMKVEPCINAEKYEGKGGKNGLWDAGSGWQSPFSLQEIF